MPVFVGATSATRSAWPARGPHKRSAAAAPRVVGLVTRFTYNSAYVRALQLPGLHPDTISINGNVITNPQSRGVYVAKGQNIEITGNRISGQRHGYDVTLPKGAIALAYANNVRALNSELTDNQYCDHPGTKVSAEGNRIVVPPGECARRSFPDAAAEQLTTTDGACRASSRLSRLICITILSNRDRSARTRRKG